MAFLRFKLRIRRTELNKTLSSDVRRPSHALKFNPLIKADYSVSKRNNLVAFEAAEGTLTLV